MHLFSYLCRGVTVTTLTLVVAGSAFACGGGIEPDRTPFLDVPESYAYADAIYHLQSMGAVTSQPDARFFPHRALIRAELAYVGYMASPATCAQDLTSDDATMPYFTDVARDSWYAAAACALREAGAIDNADGIFRPDERVGVAMMAKIATELWNLPVRPMKDDEAWYMPYIEAVSAKNALPPSISSAGQILTRGEFAELAFRLNQSVTWKEASIFAGGTFTHQAGTEAPAEDEGEAAVTDEAPAGTFSVETPLRGELESAFGMWLAAWDAKNFTALRPQFAIDSRVANFQTQESFDHAVALGLNTIAQSWFAAPTSLSFVGVYATDDTAIYAARGVQPFNVPWVTEGSSDEYLSSYVFVKMAGVWRLATVYNELLAGDDFETRTHDLLRQNLEMVRTNWASSQSTTEEATVVE